MVIPNERFGRLLPCGDQANGVSESAYDLGDGPPSSGLKLVNESAKPTLVIIDPEPTNPFERLPLLLAVTWACAIAPLIALAFLRWHPHTRKWNLGLISVLIIALVFGCFMSFGRVSPGSSIALRFAILAVLVIG